MTPVELSRTVLRAVRRAVDDGELSVDVGEVPERVVVAPPGPGGCGDYATSVALQLARPAKQPPLRVAEVLRPHLLRTAGITDVVVTGPGFLNISLEASSGVSLVREILRRGVRYGDSDALGGQLVRLHAPHEIRALVHLDALSRILRSQGALVRTSCARTPEAEWVTTLGLLPVDVIAASDTDSYGTGSTDRTGPDSYGTGSIGTDRTGTDRTGTDRTGTGSTGTDRTATGSTGTDRTAADATGTGGITAEAIGADGPPITVRPSPAGPLPLGRDAARWALLHPAPHDPPRIPGEHLIQRESNPLFRVRYAHARTRALLRNAADLGFGPEPGPLTGAVAHRLLQGLADHPRVVGSAATHRAPDRVARHLVTVADAVLPLLPSVLPLGEEKPTAAHRARLALADAAGAVLAGGLSLLGIGAPDHL
ncbi:ArgS-related anticodon-binding protein NrtL [Streptomyces sp. NPDC005931]|uniref:ArgS-related anticodon-binding protein NrtL n=1 Tax=Streptomyces sp. NPDC005931 TaxID=3364737 RepID=UPI0036B6152F